MRRATAWFLNSVAMSEAVPDRLRPRLLRLAGIDADDGALVHAGSTFCGTEVSIARGVFVNRGVFFDRGAPITIGENAAVAMRVSLITSAHAIGDADHRAGPGTWQPRPVTVERGAWLGAGCTILPGVTVGAGAVVAAGAVVSRDVPPHTLVAGIPARVVRKLD